MPNENENVDYLKSVQFGLILCSAFGSIPKECLSNDRQSFVRESYKAPVYVNCKYVKIAVIRLH